MFDCIEFSDALRWIDVASDLAFPLMDLQAHARGDLASALLNGWLQETGDFRALPALRFYIVYRALVRALVEALKARGPSAVDGLARARNYVACAARIASAPEPYLLLCHGYSGSGKSMASEALAIRLCAIRLSSDTERKRAHPFAPPDLQALPAVAYSRKAVDSHYDALLAIARRVVEAGYPVLVDATFLKQRHRLSFIELARAFDVPVFLLDFHTSVRQLAERVRKRAMDPGQSSDANAAVLVRQLANEEPLTPDEVALTVAFDTDVPLGAFQRARYWKPLLIRLHPEDPVDHAFRSDTPHWQTSGWDAIGCRSAA
jgi:predicted kinase